MTNQEKKFADEYVFQYFNSDEQSSWNVAVEAAKYAGYVLPESKPKAEEIVKALYNKDEIKEYIESQILVYKEKLYPSQRRTLWESIGAMELGEPCKWGNWGFVNH